MLVNLIDGEMSETSAPMRLSWYDLGPELNVKRLEKSIRSLASDFAIHTWSDTELRKMLSATHEAEKKRRVQALRRGMVF